MKNYDSIKETQAIIGRWATEKGWDFDAKDTPTSISLMHSELSEALEEYRNGHPPHFVYEEFDRDGFMKPEGIAIELADCMIRILHYAANFKIDMAAMIEKKMAYNFKRPYRHGGKVI